MITKNVRFHLTFKTTGYYDVIYTILSDDIIVTNNNLYLFIPTFVPSAET